MSSDGNRQPRKYFQFAKHVTVQGGRVWAMQWAGWGGSRNGFLSGTSPSTARGRKISSYIMTSTGICMENMCKNCGQVSKDIRVLYLPLLISIHVKEGKFTFSLSVALIFRGRRRKSKRRSSALYFRIEIGLFGIWRKNYNICIAAEDCLKVWGNFKVGEHSACW
jgi:hypothetical protein